jgi:hypothetical protein
MINNSQASSAAPAGGATSAGSGGMWSFHGGSAFRPMALRAGTESYNLFKEELGKAYKNINPGCKVTLIDLDRSRFEALSFSAVIVAMEILGSNREVAYHIALLEGTGEPLKKIQEKVNGNDVQVSQVTSDAINGRMLKIAANEVRRTFTGVSGDKIYFSGAVVIPRNFDMKRTDNLYEIIAQIALGNAIELRRRSGAPDLNLARLEPSKLVSEVRFNRGTRHDIVGAPYRSDFSVEFISRKNDSNNNKSNEPNTLDNQTVLSVSSGYVDQIYVGDSLTPQQQMGLYSYGQQPRQFKIVPRIVISDISAELDQTANMVLFNIYGVAAGVLAANNWMRCFRPVSTPPGTLDLTDIGAINLDANIFNAPNGEIQAFETKAAQVSAEDVFRFVQTAMAPTPVFSFVCPDYGPKSYYLDLFSLAASGSSSAQDVLLAALNELTDGRFGRYFTPGVPLFINKGEKVLLGTWKDRTGEERPLSDWGYTAMCNYAAYMKDPNCIRRFTDTFTRTDVNELQRLGDRERILDVVTNGSAVITGKANMVTFSGPAMNALLNACSELVSVRPNTDSTAAEHQFQRGEAGWAAQAMIHNLQGWNPYRGGSAGGYQQGNPAAYGYRY